MKFLTARQGLHNPFAPVFQVPVAIKPREVASIARICYSTMGPIVTRHGPAAHFATVPTTKISGFTSSCCQWSGCDRQGLRLADSFGERGRGQPVGENGNRHGHRHTRQQLGLIGEVKLIHNHQREQD